MTKKARSNKVISEETVVKVLRTVPHNNAFYFFTDIGQYSGKFASSLSEFCQKIKTINTKSVDFHFKRLDFEKWIKGTIGDVDLANEISQIKKSVRGEELRVQIHQTVEKRLTELKRLLASEEAYLDKY